LALHAAIVSIALLTLSLALLVGLYVAGYVFWFAVTRQWRIAVRPFAAGLTAALCVFAIGVINYYYTGFPSDQVIVQFWPYADLAKVMRWGTMLEIVTQHYGILNGILPFTLPISWEMMRIFASFLSLRLWSPIILLALPFVIFQLRSAASRAGIRKHLDAPAWSALGWFGGAVILVALFGGGRSQPISFYRLSTFSYAPTLCVALLLCHLGLNEENDAKAHTPWRKFFLPGLFAAALAIIAIINGHTIRTFRQSLTSVLLDAYHLCDGQFSLKDAYQNQQSSPGLPWGGIYPGIIEPWRIAGPGTRIWSFHIWSYCMLPDCNVQEFFSERLSSSWPTVLFGPVEESINALKAEGLNYFFFSPELRMGNDPLPSSPTFSPGEIAKHLAVRWTNGTSYLLTWPNDKTRPIDQKFLVAYGAAVKASGNSNFDAYKKIADYLTLHKHDLSPFCLPWSSNCQGLPRIE
jgi:hypothetical protein